MRNTRPCIAPAACLLLSMAACTGQQSASPARVADGPDRTGTRATAQVAEYVVAALEDSKGTLWFGTNGQGVARFVPSQGTKGSLRYLSLADGLIGDVVTDIAEDRTGQLWFGTHTGVSRYDGTSFTGFGPAEGLTGSGCKLLVDGKGTVWAGTSTGVFRMEGDRAVPFEVPVPEITELSYKIAPGKVWDLLEDSKGRIWFARDGYGACRYDPAAAPANGAREFTHYTKADGLCSNNVASIVEDGQGNMWFGSITSDLPTSINEGGVSRFDAAAPDGKASEVFTQFPDVHGLTANDIYNLYTDRAGNVWIGAVRVGAYRFDGRNFTLFDKTDRPDLTTYFGIQSFVEDRKGTLWFGFSGGLFRFNGTAFVNVTQGDLMD